MLELLTAFVALGVVLSISYLKGRAKKQDAVSTALESPTEVARLYLRHAQDVDAYWLHVQFRDGRKRVLATPWELADTLQLLGQRGLRLSDDDAQLWARHTAAKALAADAPNAQPARNRDVGLARIKAGVGA